MEKRIGIFLIFLSLAVIFAAGCTTSTEATNTTPQIVYVTVLVTPTPTVVASESYTITPVVTASTISPGSERDEAFLSYIDDNEIVGGMKTLSYATPSGYYGTSGYNTAAKAEAIRLTGLILEAPLPASEMMNSFRTEMLDALSTMDGSTAGFSRYKDAMQTVIQSNNAVLSEMHASGSSVVEAKHYNGHGNALEWYNTTETGLRTFTMRHTGDRNFAITLKDENDKYISLLVNEIGDYTGKKSVRLTAGAYYLDITADGDWTVSITSD